LPFVSLITGNQPITGYFLWIPIVLCLVGIVLNAFWVFSTFSQIHKRNSLIGVSTSMDFFKFKTTKRGKEVDESAFYDVFNKAAPILMIIAWICILAFYLLQKSGVMF